MNNLEALQEKEMGIIDQMETIPDTESKEYQALGRDLENVTKAKKVEYDREDQLNQIELRSRELDLKARELDIREQETKNVVEVAKIDSKKDRRKNWLIAIAGLLTTGGNIAYGVWQTRRVTKFEEDDAIRSKAWSGIHKPKL